MFSHPFLLSHSVFEMSNNYRSVTGHVDENGSVRLNNGGKNAIKYILVYSYHLVFLCS